MRDLAALASSLLARHWPRAACGFAAGSLMRGQGTATSDLDLVVLFSEPDARVYRRSLLQDGLPVEAFVHSVAAQDRFMKSDAEDGHPTMASMIAEGAVLGRDAALAEAQKEKARAILAAGPPALSPADLDRRRYFLTDALDDLAAPRDGGERTAVLVKLYTTLADFQLRANGRWSGTGKGLLRALRAGFPAVAPRFEVAFSAGFAGDPSLVARLADDILAPFGGRLWDGYEAEAKQ
jgi:hypothetical protein